MRSSETEYSETELEEASTKPYKDLAEGRVRVRFSHSNQGYRCPYYAGRRRVRYYSFRVLLDHAKGIARGSVKRRVKEKANHFALEKYLKENEGNMNG